MRKYLLHVLIISFVFLLTPIVPAASDMGEIETYKQEVEKNPDDAEAHYILGDAYISSRLRMARAILIRNVNSLFILM